LVLRIQGCPDAGELVYSKALKQFGYKRGVAQPGRAPASGAGGREFKSLRPDHDKQRFMRFCINRCSIGPIHNRIEIGEKMEVKTISVEDAKKKLEEGGTVFVDVRDPESYERAHIPGAILVNDNNVQEFISSTDKTRTHIIYCFHGINSEGGAAYFTENGFEDVFSMDGGFGAWPKDMV
jgi:thiosulfate sulfurtransferase